MDEKLQKIQFNLFSINSHISPLMFLPEIRFYPYQQLGATE
jgi:hypothetical protein